MRGERFGAAVRLTAAAALSAAAVAHAVAGPGLPAPDVVFRGVAGEAVRLSDLRGRPVVLAFWATWCTRCLDELDHLRKVRADHAEDRLAILAVSVDEDRLDLDAFLARRSYPFIVCHDPAGAAAAAFRESEDLPFTVVIDASGTIRHVFREFPVGAEHRLDAAISSVLR